MPHLPIIVDLEALLGQIDQYHETITENIANNMYSGKQLEDAQALLANAESWLSATKLDADAHVANMEGFLGI